MTTAAGKNGDIITLAGQFQNEIPTLAQSGSRVPSCLSAGRPTMSASSI
jgi:hypothetical protein